MNLAPENIAQDLSTVSVQPARSRWAARLGLAALVGAAFAVALQPVHSSEQVSNQTEPGTAAIVGGLQVACSDLVTRQEIADFVAQNRRNEAETLQQAAVDQGRCQIFKAGERVFVDHATTAGYITIRPTAGSVPMYAASDSVN